jgi:NAD(P)-dependent dehydrogenase (short-subunit alcohol dehydrogenase family)
MRCTGKIVLVTGAQQGIGRAMALAAEGADVAINWLDDEAKAEGVAAEVRAAGRRALLVRADLGKIAAAKEMVATVERDLGPIDVLVNNAGVFPRVSFLDMEEGDWDFVLDINLTKTSRQRSRPIRRAGWIVEAINDIHEMTRASASISPNCGNNLAEEKLAGEEWTAGRFSISDIHLFRLFWRYVDTVRPDLAAFPSLTAHYHRMLARPAVKKTLEVEGAIGFVLPP